VLSLQCSRATLSSVVGARIAPRNAGGGGNVYCFTFSPKLNADQTHHPVSPKVSRTYNTLLSYIVAAAPVVTCVFTVYVYLKKKCHVGVSVCERERGTERQRDGGVGNEIKYLARGERNLIVMTLRHRGHRIHSLSRVL